MGLGRIISAVIGVLDRLEITSGGVYTPPSGAGTLAETLTEGNTSGANDLVMDAGQTITTPSATIGGGALGAAEVLDVTGDATRKDIALNPGTSGKVLIGGTSSLVLGVADATGVQLLRSANGEFTVYTGSASARGFINLQHLTAMSGSTGKVRAGPTRLDLSSDTPTVWMAGTEVAGGTPDTGLSRSAARVVRVTNGSTGYGTVRAEYPRREFSVHKTPGTAATLTAVGGTPTHTLTGTASDVSDSTGHYVQLSADTALAGIDIATTECTKTESGPIVTFTIKTGAVLPIATERLWVGLSSASLTTTDSPTGAHVLAFRYGPTTDGTAFWRAVSNDGGGDTGTTTTSTVAIAAATRYVLTIDATSSSSVTFYVNGALIATHTTNLPTATQALGTQCFVDDVAGDSTKELLVSKINFETN